jgi:hypothetical protein
MNDRTRMAAVKNDFLQQESNLNIAKRKGIFLNAPVDLSRSQPSQRKLPASAGGPKS